MAKRDSSPGISPAKNEYGIEAGQILMQNIQERLTGLWPATGASSSKHFSFSLKKNHGFSARCPAFFSET